MILWGPLLWSCGGVDSVAVEAAHGGALISGPPYVAVDVVDPHGTLVRRQRWPKPVSQAWVPLPPADVGGTWSVHLQTVRGGDHRGSWKRPPQPPLQLVLQAGGTEEMDLSTATETTVAAGLGSAGIFAEVGAAGWLRIDTNGTRLVDREVRPGDRVGALLDLTRGRTVTATLDDHTVRVELRPDADPAAQLLVSRPVLPATPDGKAAPAQAPSQVQLRPDWFTSWAPQSRPSRWLPRTYVGVDITNPSTVPRMALVEATVPDAPAFVPPGGRATTVAAVSAGETKTVAVPVYADPDLLAPGVVELTVDVTQPGRPAPDATHTIPIALVRPRLWPVVWSGTAACVALGGWAWLWRRWSSWFSPPRALRQWTSVALLSSLLFVAGAAGRAAAGVVAAALGPFAAFATAWADDLLRYALVLTALWVRPRPGTAAVSLLIVWAMGAVLLGSLAPTDPVVLGARIAWTEGLLFVAGTTRGALTAGRTAGALALANALSSLTILALGMVLYRLHYAGWYVAALIAGPGLLYVLVACLWTAPWARRWAEVRT